MGGGFTNNPVCVRAKDVMIIRVSDAVVNYKSTGLSDPHRAGYTKIWHTFPH